MWVSHGYHRSTLIKQINKIEKRKILSCHLVSDLFFIRVIFIYFCFPNVFSAICASVDHLPLVDDASGDNRGHGRAAKGAAIEW